MLVTSASLTDSQSQAEYKVEVAVLPPNNLVHITAHNSVLNITFELLDQVFDNGRILIFPLIKRAFEDTSEAKMCTCDLQALPEQKSIILNITVPALDVALKFVLLEKTNEISASEITKRLNGIEDEVSSLVKELPNTLQSTMQSVNEHISQTQRFDYDGMSNKIRTLVKEEIQAVVEMSSKTDSELVAVKSTISEYATAIDTLRTEVKQSIESISNDERLTHIGLVEEKVVKLSTQQETSTQELEKEMNNLKNQMKTLLDVQHNLIEKLVSLSQQTTTESTTIQNEVRRNSESGVELMRQVSELSNSQSQTVRTELNNISQHVATKSEENKQGIKQLENTTVQQIESLKELIETIRRESKGAVEQMVDQYYDYCKQRVQHLLSLNISERSLPDKCINTIEFKTAKVNSLIVLPGSPQMIATSHDHSNINVWNLKQGTLFRSFDAGERDVVGLTVVDENTIVFGYFNSRNLKVFDWKNGVCLNTINTNADLRVATHKQILVFGDQKQYAAVAHRSTAVINVYDIRKQGGRHVRSLVGHTLDVNCIQFLPNGRLVSASNDSTIRIWDMDKGECVSILSGHNDWVRSLDLLDEKMLLSGGDDGTVRIWDIDSGKQIKTITRDIGWVYDIVVLSRQLIMTASKDGKIRVYNIDRSECVRSLSGHRKDVTSVVVLDDNKIVSGSDDGTMRLWGLSTSL